MNRQNHSEALADLGAARHKIAIYWRLYVAWLTEIGWGRLALLSLLAVILGSMLMLPGLATWLILVSIVVKLFAGSRRPAPALPDRS
ncbi:hypothetical protein CXB49_14975 [Chromobacterium sp. ATCC 53434]|uniref:hypothetical protein n=1 Tax=Chromobacterium TaxID=535 RepID=UPI000C78875E|nr:hypothetical protein [Chromobacterium sp. ATCC 53434]AUH52027.1 hypothetical protein CXB49_14975 [Chromobacterium sp. ATCC 53434]